MIVARLAFQSLRNRMLTASLTALAIAVSVMLLLGVEKIRTGARQSFADTISKADLIVGARSGSIQLLLYSVFRIGNATNNITWESYQAIEQHPDVAWTVPMSLGDSHKGFRVLGTTRGYFEHYRFRGNRELAFASGTAFDDLFDIVLGSDVASTLGYKLGDQIVIAHGAGSISFIEHADKPFRVSGILAKTGTPVDRTLHVSLAAIEAIHIDWQSGVPGPDPGASAAEVRNMNLSPKAITAAIIGVKSKLAIFKLQRWINEYREEPLAAIMPGVALQELWGLVGIAETALAVVSAMVVATALLGMVTTILTTLSERRREMAILRSVGAGPTTILGLLVAEAALLSFIGVATGTLLLYVAIVVFAPLVDQLYGLHLNVVAPTSREYYMLLGIVVAGLLAGLIPALRAYRMSVADGMIVRT